MHNFCKVLYCLLFLNIFLSNHYSNAQTTYNTLPSGTFDNYKDTYIYTYWNDNFKTSGVTDRTFVNQTSAYNLSINFSDLTIHSLNLTTTNHDKASALEEANANTFATTYVGDIDYAILQNGAVTYSKSTSPTSNGISDSQMAEYGTWQNRRFVSTNFTNSAPVDAYFTGVEFTNWHNRFRMTFHVKPTSNITNGQLQFEIDIPTAYSTYLNQGNMHAFGLSTTQGFAVKGGSTANNTVINGNTITVTTATQTLVAGTAYEVSVLFYALKSNLSTDYADIDTEEAEISITANQSAPNTQSISASYIADEGIHLLDLPVHQLGYTNCSANDIMQDIDLNLENTTNADKRVRLCFQHTPSSNVVGYNAMIRHANGDPSGLPLQASKNWHTGVSQLYSGSWNREYTEIIVPANSIINCKYTRTGAKWGETYGAFSHQLSTVGTGQSRGGWLEAGLGGYGENITHSPDYQFGNSNACDYRPFLVTNDNAPYNGTSSECNWTGNVGGMDMFVYVDGNGTRQYPSEVKTRFHRYSPNLTETTVSSYSSDKKLKLDYTFYLNRSDDFTRVYYKLKVKAVAATTFNRFDIFQMGGDNYNVHKAQQIYYGNDSDTIGSFVPDNSGVNDYTSPAFTITGNNPWLWAGNGIYTNGYGGINIDTNNGMILRSYSGTFNGVTNNTPYIRERSSSTGFAAASGHNPTSYCIVPPTGTTSFAIGDEVEVMVEAIILPKQAVDYYGPNTNFANALTNDGNTYELMFREVAGNKATATSTSNTINNNYPISIATVNNEATFTLTGGKGYVPVIFTGLSEVETPKLWKSDGSCWEAVDQSYHGNDFWQADYNSDTETFDLIFNLNQDSQDDSESSIEYYLGDTAPDFSELLHEYSVNSVSTSNVNSFSVSLGETVVLSPIVSGSSTNVGTWTWTLPDNSTFSGQDLTIASFGSNDDGDYSVIFVNSQGCSMDLSYKICHTPTNLIPQSNIDGSGWSISTNINLASGSQVHLAPQVTEAGSTSPGAGTWAWTGPNGYTNSGRAIFVYSTDFSGTYTYTYTNVCGAPISSTFEVTTPVLPVELITFTANAIDNKTVRLNWETASELHNKGFQVERSFDGEEWEALAFVEGKGTTTKTQSYTYLDNLPNQGINYYRLKQIDFDGQFEYSQIRVVTISKNNQFLIYPNPTKSSLFYLQLQIPSTGDVMVYDMQGTLLYQKAYDQAQQQFEISLPKNIAAGLYIVEFVNPDIHWTERLMVE